MAPTTTLAQCVAAIATLAHDGILVLRVADIADATTLAASALCSRFFGEVDLFRPAAMPTSDGGAFLIASHFAPPPAEAMAHLLHMAAACEAQLSASPDAADESTQSFMAAAAVGPALKTSWEGACVAAALRAEADLALARSVAAGAHILGGAEGMGTRWLQQHGLSKAKTHTVCVPLLHANVSKQRSGCQVKHCMVGRHKHEMQRMALKTANESVSCRSTHGGQATAGGCRLRSTTTAPPLATSTAPPLATTTRRCRSRPRIQHSMPAPPHTRTLLCRCSPRRRRAPPRPYKQSRSHMPAKQTMRRQRRHASRQSSRRCCRRGTRRRGGSASRASRRADGRHTSRAPSARRLAAGPAVASLLPDPVVPMCNARLRPRWVRVGVYSLFTLANHVVPSSVQAAARVGLRGEAAPHPRRLLLAAARR
jgi:hypothetical protein